MKSIAMILGLVMLGACGAEKPAAPVAEKPAAVPSKGNDITAGGETWSADKGTATVKGVVKFEGNAPPRKPVDVGAEKFCVDRHKDEPLMTESVVVGADGGVANVLIQVTSGLENWKFEPATGEVVLDQSGCQYKPHLLAAQVGQVLKVKNSDPIMHNVHGIKNEKDEFNWAQTKAGLEDTKDLKKAGRIEVKCDVHGWMKANIWVLKHPFFVVTGENGTFELPKLPPGTYTIEAWHEVDKLKSEPQSVTVGDGETKEIVFKFAVK